MSRLALPAGDWHAVVLGVFRLRSRVEAQPALTRFFLDGAADWGFESVTTHFKLIWKSRDGV